ncbi:hypothetical protein [Pyxidicoccus sp. MSG2]|uniref:hypothetical protein n=1 Tax=Pyxidicoccus sp. MSG2 TaxID=2996790 RepID=UPI00226EAC39|nr:hypothetical protein [Pyxidicoccus sp. MSG2]MCY1023786.1 hypothetical protein [Pyxidicoccus sp. MSG2]
MGAGRKSRGSALLTTVAFTMLILVAALALLTYANQSRRRAINNTRSIDRQACTEAGLQLARAYFGRNFTLWNTYLDTPASYNPVASSWNTVPAAPTTPALRGSRPELFSDLDGDGASDVYIYIRDNEDERFPATINWRRDNDHTVIVGAVCISRTLVPRLGGAPDPDSLSTEGLLSYNDPASGYRSQGYGGASGTGNLN